MTSLYFLRAFLLIGALGSQAAVWGGAWYLWDRLNQKGWHGCLDVPGTSSGYCVATRKADGPIKGERCAVFGEASFCVGLGSARRPDWRMCVADNRTQSEAVILGCTRIIEAAVDTPINIGTAYYNRANARWAIEARNNRAQPALMAAINDFDEAIKRRPNWGEAFLARSTALSRMRRDEASYRDLDEAIRLMPKRSDLLHRRAFRLTSQDRYDDAIADYTALIRLNPADDLAISFRGTYRALQMRWSEALTDHETAYRLKPAPYRLGLICGVKIQLDRVRDALADCDRALTQSPDPGSYENRGLARFILGDLDGARTDWQRVTTLQPGSIRQNIGRYGLFMIREIEGDAAGAAADFENLHASVNNERFWNWLEATMGRFRKR